MREDTLPIAVCPKERTYVTGSPMAEVLHNNLAEIEASDVHRRLCLEKGKYILLSAHREEKYRHREELPFAFYSYQ